MFVRVRLSSTHTLGRKMPATRIVLRCYIHKCNIKKNLVADIPQPNEHKKEKNNCNFECTSFNCIPSVRSHGILGIPKDTMAIQDRAKANHDLGKDAKFNHVLDKGSMVANPFFW